MIKQSTIDAEWMRLVKKDPVGPEWKRTSELAILWDLTVDGASSRAAVLVKQGILERQLGSKNYAFYRIKKTS